MTLTDAGRAVARAAERIGSLEQLHQEWFARLSGRQVRILEALIKRYPQAIGRDELAEASRQSAASSGYTNNLGTLRSLGVVDCPRPREVIATSMLFPPKLDTSREAV